MISFNGERMKKRPEKRTFGRCFYSCSFCKDWAYFFRLWTGIIIWDSRFIWSGLAHSYEKTTLRLHFETWSATIVGPPSVCVCVWERESECLHGQTHNWSTNPQCGWNQPLHLNTHTHRNRQDFAKASSARRPHFNKLRERLGPRFIKCPPCLWSDWGNMFFCTAAFVFLRNARQCDGFWSVFEAGTSTKRSGSFSCLCFPGWFIVRNPNDEIKNIFSSGNEKTQRGCILGSTEWKTLMLLFGGSMKNGT